jgi:ribonuclease HI
MLNANDTRSSKSILTDTVDRVQSIYNLFPDVTIELKWCPGHKEIRGNEIVDVAAKSAIFLPPLGIL